MDNLPDIPAHHSESRTKRFMALDKFLQTLLQQADIQITFELDGKGHIISSSSTAKLLLNVHSSLRRRNRIVLSRLHMGNRHIRTCF
ncbi:hypothetical protein D3C86_922690 [compost metagenome]